MVYGEPGAARELRTCALETSDLIFPDFFKLCKFPGFAALFRR